jgi:histidinol-phosphate aminotransferase
MTSIITDEGKDDLLSRGYSRRHLLRSAIILGGASALPAFHPEWALAGPSVGANTKIMIHIGANECWTGPFPEGVAAGSAILPKSNRYMPGNERGDFIRAVAQMEKVPEDHVSPWPGSSEPLARAIVAFCSPTKGLVTANPSYEAAGSTAEYLKVPIKAVPLKGDYSHDVKAMVAANPNAGVYYIVNPNNPTGTMTPTADIEWLVANKPAGSIVLIDEAYIHWSDAYPNNTASHLATQGKDVIILRTFSKIFGMAGARMGFFMARPDLIKKLEMYDGGALSYMLPLPTLVCATASLTARDEFAMRRKELVANRTRTIAYLAKHNLKVIGNSQANFIMVDWKNKTAKEMQVAFRAQNVEIAGPRWAVWPTVSRISIGSKEDMEGFFSALDKVASA